MISGRVGGGVGWEHGKQIGRYSLFVHIKTIALDAFKSLC